MDKQKRLIVILLMLTMIASGLAIYLYIKNLERDQIKEGMYITFVSPTGVCEYGEVCNPQSFVEKASDPMIQVTSIDNKKLGLQTVSFTLQHGTVEKVIEYQIEIKDSKPPVITLKQEEVSLQINDSFEIEDYIISIKDPIDGDLMYSKVSQDGRYTIKSDVDTEHAGNYTVTITAYDIAHQKAEKILKVEVIQKAEKIVSSNQTTSNPDAVSPTYINGILLVNKTHPLPESYGGTDPVAYAALQQLQQNAAQAGYAMPLISGYRSYEYQVTLYNNYVARDGQAAADRYSAKPGYSEHQSGLCFDVGSIDNDYGTTAAGKWLNAHAHEYGFIIRFPDGKENITGYMYEPWHIRYVGVEIATDIYQQQLTLEEYLGAY